MDKVRLDIYKHVALKLIKAPPLLPLFNALKFKISEFSKKSIVNHYPISIVLYTNKLCNFSCSFCYNQEVLNRPDSIKYNLTLEQLNKILETPYGRRALRVAFLGGEPFLNPHIIELINSPLLSKKITNVVTNASKLSGKLLEDLISSQIDVIGLSLYDNNISDVQRVVERLNKSTKKYWVQTVVDATKLENLSERLEICHKMGVKNLILSNYNPYFDESYEKVSTSSNKELKFHEKYLKDKYNSVMSIQWINPIPQDKKRKKSCKLPFSYIHLDNQGDMAPCCFRYPDGKKYGNIFSEERWNSEGTVKLRENMLNQEIAPVGECNNCENLYRDLYGI